MTTLFAIIAVVLTVAIIFGRIGGMYDKQYVPDLEMIDQYLQRVNPSLVRHK